MRHAGFLQDRRAFRQSIGAPRAPSLAAEINSQLAPAVAGLADEERLAHQARGRALDLATAVDHALVFCEWVAEAER